MRSCFDAGDSIKSNPLFVKLRNLFSYLLTQGMLNCVGLSLTEEEFSRSSIRNYHTNYSSKFDLWWCVLDTTITILERVDDFKNTGRISSFVHGRDKYENWLDKTDELLALAPYTGNLEPHGTNAFSFHSDLTHQIEIGNSIVSHSRMLTNTNNVYIAKKLQALKMLKASEITRKASQMERPAPFGILVHGKSSIGKSSFTRMLFQYFGKLLKYETGDEFMYARSPADDFWSGFDTSKWCIRLDDVAFLDPLKAMMDKTLECILNVINNVPFNPPQASLEDKGRTPVRAELVIATSNRADLYADQYFSCPLAILRRFPFIVHLTVKKEYLQDPIKTGDGMKVTPFLDPGKIPPMDGFPDLWEIEVQRIVPDCRGEGETGKDYAKFEVTHKFSDVNEFLKFYGEQILLHRTNQKRALGADQYMSELTVCRECLYVGDKCKCLEVQSCDIVDSEGSYCLRLSAYYFNLFAFFVAFCCFGRFVSLLYAPWLQYFESDRVPKKVAHFRFKNFLVRPYSYLVSSDYFIKMLLSLGKYEFVRWSAGCLIVPYLRGRLQMTVLGAWCDTPSKKRIAIIVSMLGVVALSYAAFSHFNKGKNVIPKNMNVQSTRDVDTRFEKETENNVWYNPTIQLTSFDVPIASRSLVGKSDVDIGKMFQRNCVHLSVRFKERDTLRSVTRTNCGVFVKGQHLLTHNHTFPTHIDADYYDITIVNSPVSGGISSNISFRLYMDDIIRDVTNDLALITVRSVSPYKDIMKYWGEDSLGNISKGFFLRRNEHGCIEQDVVRNAVLQRDWPVEQINSRGDMYLAELNTPTMKGHCGSLLIHATPRGPIISAFHLLGRGTTVGYMVVKLSSIKSLISESENLLGTMKVCGGGEPMLNADKSNFAISGLHPKSIMRYCEGGTAQLYGGLKGFRPAPRSKVRCTPKKDLVCEHFAYEVGHGPPVMNGWKPWRNNLVDMISPSVLHSRGELHTIAVSFLNDIEGGLPLSWKQSLHVLPDFEAVNGIPGVKFIDSINRSSSMGHPWNSTKKAYLVPEVNDDYPDGVDFPPEIWSRVRHMEDIYAEGGRNFPIFTEHLKDEPVSFAKISAEKTRAFSGAPIDMALLVRKYYLSFVRMLQMNKFVFEAAPGVNPTSPDWTAIYSYLVQHGEDRMIAGDYSKYDKKMISDLILEAFWIIIELHKKAGWDDRTTDIMWGLATDTAFPLINFNGDLIEFFGTNPSGHPLTVVINSLVNSLYMRWMYKRLNPAKECSSFKENVSLMTYGDDNIMGVSKETPWFNHTTIQKELAAFNIVYTMADKESETVPYIHIDDCEFLKRKWRYDTALGHHACPLNILSILKSLTVWTPSGSICAEEQFVNIVVSANMELFFHGFETFTKHHEFLKQLVSDKDHEIYLPSCGLLGWDDFVDKFKSI